MIQLTDITLTRGSQQICDGLSLIIGKGQAVVITGPNGSGKSSLLACLMGQLKPSHGEVLLDGLDLHHLKRTQQKAFLKATGVVLQESHLRRYDRVQQVLKQTGASAEEVDQMIALLKLSDERQAMVKDLSYSEKRKLELGRSLLNSPQLIVWDEPWLGLDEETKMSFRPLLLDLKKAGLTCIISTLVADDFQFLNPDTILQL